MKNSWIFFWLRQNDFSRKLILVIGPDQKFLIQVGSFFVGRVETGQPPSGLENFLVENTISLNFLPFESENMIGSGQ